MRNAIQFFKRVIANQKLSHLYLLTGEKGSPLMTTALTVASLIIDNMQENLALKKQVLANKFANLYVIDKVDTILKEDIFLLQNEFSKTSVLNTKRVFIINHFDLITVQASNMLLKFLEEPINAQTVGLLLTDNIDAILNTITSRAQVIRIPQGDKKELLKKLTALSLPLAKAEVLVNLTNDLTYAKELAQNQYFDEALALAIKLYECIALKKEIVPAGQYLMHHPALKEVYYFLCEILFLFSLDLMKSNAQKFAFSTITSLTKQIKDNLKKEQIITLCKLNSDFVQKEKANLIAPLSFLNYLIQMEEVVQ